jgi:hypothetical protein
MNKTLIAIAIAAALPTAWRTVFIKPKRGLGMQFGVLNYRPLVFS